MNLAFGFCLCVLCGWLTVGALAMPTSSGFRGAESSRTVSADGFSTTPGAACENVNVPDRNEGERRIDETENALNAIQRPRDAEEQKTATQIRTRITRARDALQHDDMDGAGILSKKARALLLELCKEFRRHSEEKAKLKPIQG
jgi:exonuclease VII large subunit